MTRRLLLPSKSLFVPKKPAVLRIWDEEALEYSEGGGGLISAAQGYVGPGDAVGVAPTAFWGIRSASAAILAANTNIARISNNVPTTHDFAGSSGNNGFVSPSAISSFFGGGSGLAPTILYEQINLNTADRLTNPFANAPAWNNTGISSSIPSMDFVAANSTFLQATSDAFVQTVPYTVGIVAKHLSSATAQVIITFPGGTGLQIRYRIGGANEVDSFSSSNGAATCSDNAYHSIIAVMENGATASELWVDGVPTLSLTTGANNLASASAILLGANSATPDFVLDGSICEVGFWNGHMGTSAIGALHNNHSTSYVGAGIP
jgi:hypothetical protein